MQLSKRENYLIEILMKNNMTPELFMKSILLTIIP